ncbi:MAG TPA: DciA family protein [Burkholderiales bacterium]|nr:DciA family protein [Burkholderiales bacterium]
MPLNTIGKLLGTTEELKALSARTRRLRELQTLYVRSAPRELVSSSRVKSYRAGTLVISTDNAAVAAKLKQLAPRVLVSIREIESEVTGIRIEVQVSGGHSEARRKSLKSGLPPEAIKKFGELAESVANEDLKSALGRLVRRHSKDRPR